MHKWVNPFKQILLNYTEKWAGDVKRYVFNLIYSKLLSTLALHDVIQFFSSIYPDKFIADDLIYHI